MNELANIYQCQEMLHLIETEAAQNETGEITEEQFQALVLAQTTSLAKLEKIVNYTVFLKSYIEAGQCEIERIHNLITQAKKRLQSVKDYITPFVDAERERLGRPLDVGTHRLSTRHTKSVVITDPESFAKGTFPNESRTKIIHEPDKQAIAAYINQHGSHPGAEIQKNINLHVK